MTRLPVRGLLRLFGDFTGYVDFFLLQDLVEEFASTVKFFTDAYFEYRQRAIEFIESGNRRIAA